MLVRRSAAAITLTIVLVVLPLIAGMVLPGTLAALADVHDARRRAGDAARQAADRHPRRAVGADRAVGRASRWCSAYAAVGLGLAWWQLRRRDA